MANEYVNKVIYGGNALIDLTGDTVTASDVQSGKIFHLANGTTTSGTNTWDANTQSGNALASEILSGRKAWVKANEVTGSMPNIGTTTLIISTTNQVSIPQGYHDGSGKAGINSTEFSNIRESVTILGVVGTMSGSEDVHATTSIFTPLTTTTTITPPEGYNYFTQFTVNAIPYSEQENSAGGKTVSIATANN